MKKLLIGGVVIVVTLGGVWFGYTTLTEKDADSDHMCAQVITDARNPETGEVREFPTPCDVPDGWDTLETDREFFSRDGQQWERYRNDDLGIRFEFKTEPDGYILIEQNVDTVAYTNLVTYLSLFDTDAYAELLASTEPREGPPAISVLIFDNPDNLTPAEWIQVEPQISNINLALSEIMHLTFLGLPAVRYMSDGLFVNDTVVAENNGRIYMISGSYDQEGSAIRSDFLEMLTYVSLY